MFIYILHGFLFILTLSLNSKVFYGRNCLNGWHRLCKVNY